jgi:methyl-accepting chemotaxis protein
MDHKSSNSISWFGYVWKTLLIVIPCAAGISYLVGLAIGIRRETMAAYVITNTLIAIFIVLLASSKNYLLYVKPSVNFINVLKNVVTNRDLTGRITKMSKGEIGEIEHYYNMFISEVHTVMNNIFAASQVLNKSSDELSRMHQSQIN